MGTLAVFIFNNLLDIILLVIIAWGLHKLYGIYRVYREQKDLNTCSSLKKRKLNDRRVKK